jgi:uncharacterized FAD-dependent dehydrogenase
MAIEKEFVLSLSQIISGGGIEVAAEAAISKGQRLSGIRVLRKSIDARSREIKLIYKVAIYHDGEIIPPAYREREFQHVNDQSKRIVIIGAGPAGLFAALKCLELGIKPVVIERGKDVRARRRDLVSIHREHRVNPDSNYCFGEGGAGTYSDGKLYTRSTKRGDVRSILETLVQFGASDEILADAHPHIGTNKLPGIIESIRERIRAMGGEVHFDTRMTDVSHNGEEVLSITLSSGELLKADAYILATGHSARDVFELLHNRNIRIEFKPFAVGVRAEHPQSLVDTTQYRCSVRPSQLPAASYSLVHQVGGVGVYSFCMCPGGIIAPCATEQEEIVTNGWSPSKRNNPFANSGIVVPVSWTEMGDFQRFGPLAGMHYQRSIEHACWQAGGGTQVAPAQRLVDFMEQRKSSVLGQTSYQPGVVSADLNGLLPEWVSSRLRPGFEAFGKKMKGYVSDAAMLVAPETRTSSPVRIPRHPELLHHADLCNLYPCAEGAGYAGGIVSAAMDGERVVMAALQGFVAK